VVPLTAGWGIGHVAPGCYVIVSIGMELSVAVRAVTRPTHLTQDNPIITLQTVSKLMDAMGGTLTATCADNTVFEVCFPAARDANSLEEPRDISWPSSSGKRVLVIDSDLTFRAILCETLRIWGFDPVERQNLDRDDPVIQDTTISFALVALKNEPDPTMPSALLPAAPAILYGASAPKSAHSASGRVQFLKRGFSAKELRTVISNIFQERLKT
jgi:hypothetical protein